MNTRAFPADAPVEGTQWAFFWLGRLVEYSGTEELFTNPKQKHTKGA
jgi:ABC-type phosphate transport system ATPase subunit